METYTIFKLKNLTPLHMGTGKENYDFSASELQSDTISAALAAMRAQQGRAADIEAFLSSFSISSAFPYLQCGEDVIYFLPKPLCKLNIVVKGEKEEQYRKRLKKIQFIDASLWQELIGGKQLLIEAAQLQGTFLFSENSAALGSTLYKSQVLQRVSVPRADGEDATPFFFEWTFFDRNSGLYCLIDAAQSDMEQEIEQLFTALGENGIGTDRSVGGGRFEIEKECLTLSFPHESNAAMLLSLYIPAEQEMESLQLMNASYSLLQRGGYISGSDEVNLRHLRKRSVYMFSVGSLFPTKAEMLKGKVVNLRPAYNSEKMHPVFRSGLPLAIPFKIIEV